LGCGYEAVRIRVKKVKHICRTLFMEICLEMVISQVNIVQAFHSHGGQVVAAVACYAIGKVLKSCRIFQEIWQLSFHRTWPFGN
jgi:hypothetical protein